MLVVMQGVSLEGLGSYTIRALFSAIKSGLLWRNIRTKVPSWVRQKPHFAGRYSPCGYHTWLNENYSVYFSVGLSSGGAVQNYSGVLDRTSIEKRYFSFHRWEVTMDKAAHWLTSQEMIWVWCICAVVFIKIPLLVCFIGKDRREGSSLGGQIFYALSALPLCPVALIASFGICIWRQYI